MPRRPRYDLLDGLTHVTARGNRHQEIFTDRRDQNRYLSAAADALPRFHVRCLSYCLMGNHVHLVLDATRANLSHAIHRLNGAYAQWFNARHGLDGHLFQGRFHAVSIVSDWHLLELLRYVALNPVRGGLCAAPGDWRWSSYRALVGRSEAPRFLAVDAALRPFGRERRAAQNAFAAFVHEGLVATRLAA
jgi:putative transposase